VEGVDVAAVGADAVGAALGDCFLIMSAKGSAVTAGALALDWVVVPSAGASGAVGLL